MAPAPLHAPVSGEISTVLGKGSEFEGKLTFEGTVRIDGRMRGEIFSEDTLVIGEGAEVHAKLDVAEVIIQGHLVGDVHAKRGVEILAPGRVRGNLVTPALVIEKGVIFEGNCQMEAAVQGVQPAAAFAVVPGAPPPPRPLPPKPLGA
jgi:cytoskeletal protein CcmA (bactofilin family)